jgi:hypothetical protein
MGRREPPCAHLLIDLTVKLMVVVDKMEREGEAVTAVGRPSHPNRKVVPAWT